MIADEGSAGCRIHVERIPFPLGISLAGEMREKDWRVRAHGSQCSLSLPLRFPSRLQLLQLSLYILFVMTLLHGVPSVSRYLPSSFALNDDCEERPPLERTEYWIWP